MSTFEVTTRVTYHYLMGETKSELAGWILYDLGRMARAERRIAALESLLLNHGQHLSGCRYGEQRPDAECTCGLEALTNG